MHLDLWASKSCIRMATYSAASLIERADFLQQEEIWRWYFTPTKPLFQHVFSLWHLEEQGKFEDLAIFNPKNFSPKRSNWSLTIHDFLNQTQQTNSPMTGNQGIHTQPYPKLPNQLPNHPSPPFTTPSHPSPPITYPTQLFLQVNPTAITELTSRMRQRNPKVLATLLISAAGMRAGQG